ncbi:hypothetical protein RO3G_03602 [Rhizopus delemar RA 99-880]|uniref:Transposase Tc1-like domain-containing protein n=1 Tax=Rhizopus delemar (strain RA 99-880 / ATCC MYA-4621 / FGSC 9543 / NRRL 43880) TaxID=246409 RepID=I1BRR7_RHIO9|nr:hypothetical protein RO3G_03602 [Rhizopus delemar RA 99-880]|eukprot:EIE78897.1 hypothetical protein RO3G_03602 [Rhizopus delemar RA 99-880]
MFYIIRKYNFLAFFWYYSVGDNVILDGAMAVYKCRLHLYNFGTASNISISAYNLARHRVVPTSNMQPISEDLLKTTGASRGTVQNVRKTIKNEVNSIKAGRPKLLSSRDDQYLVRLVTVKGQENAVEARNTLENDLQKVVTAQTARRSLRRSGLTSFVKSQKPLLSEVNIRKRLDWALNHVDWTIEDWKRVIWSDETKVNRFGSGGKVYAWKQPNEKLKRRIDKNIGVT